MEWAFAYFTWQRRSRVILEVPREPAPMSAPAEVTRILSLEEVAQADARLRKARGARERQPASRH